MPTTDGTALGLTVQGNYAYVGDWGDPNGSPAGILHVFDVTDPCAPQLIGKAATTTPAANELGDLVVRNGTAYLANDANGLARYDVAKLLTPSFLDQRLDGSMAHALAYDGGRYAYVGQIYSSGRELAIYDLNTFPATAPTFYAPTFSGHRDIYTVQVADGRAYVMASDGNGTNHFQILDLTTPTTPTLIGDVELLQAQYGGMDGELRVHGNYVYVATSAQANHTGGLVVLDITTPATPQVVGTLFLTDAGRIPWKGTGLAVAGTEVFLAGQSALYTISVANPAQPVVTGQQSFPATFGPALGGRVVVKDGYAYVSVYRDVATSTSKGGLAVYKLDQDLPRLAASPANGPAAGTIVLNGTGFTPGGYAGTLTWDGQPLQSVAFALGGTVQITVTIPSDATVGTHTVALCAGATCPGSQNAWATVTVEPGLVDMPTEETRRATEFLEEMRNSPMAPGWETARLSGVVQPLYRPDVEGPAYYEFAVVTSTSPLSSQAVSSVLAETLPAGYIILATGSHDYPIPHWNSTGEPPTTLLNQVAAANGQTAEKYYKLDSLSYAAEDHQGALVATLGAQPAKVSGINVTQPVTESAATWQPSAPASDDGGSATMTGTLTTSGPAAPDGMQITTWESWQALKTGYKASYQPLITSLTQQADADWTVETSIISQGVALSKGQSYNLPLLSDRGALVGLDTLPTITLTGPGSALVQTRVLTTNVPPIYQLTVLNAVIGQDTPLEVQISYANGRSETVKFTIRELLPERVFLPVVTTRLQGKTGSITPANATLQGNWGAWSYAWAGSHEDQRMYDQISKGSAPNTSACWSGCGPTAWAMLFGWADYQASLNQVPWKGRWGLYRANGGYGGDAVAPRLMDKDFGVRTMIWELRNEVGTFCLLGQGATYPWNMSKAALYLQNRSNIYLATHYNVLGIATPDLRDRARDVIRYRATPVIIGTGWWLQHYPLAYGYMVRSRTVKILFWSYTEYQHQFYVNQGNGGTTGWVSGDTWFVGEIAP